MKAVKYQVEIYESALNFVHGFGYTMEEIFIPKKKIAFNIIGNQRLNVFKTNKARGKGKEIKLDDTFVTELANLFESNEKCYKLAQVYFKDKVKKNNDGNC